MRYTLALLFGLSAVGLIAVFLGRPEAKEAREDEKQKTGSEKKKRSPRIEAPPVPLTELVQDADRIFLGVITKIADVRSEDSALRGVPIEEVSFKIEKVYKGALKDEFKIRQAKSIGVFQEKMGRLLVYLSPDSRVGLTQPIGVYSGCFKISAVKGVKGPFVATNLHGNEDLWGESTFLVGDPKWGIEALSKQLEEFKLTAERRKLLLATAHRPKVPGPLPLELLEAATQVLIAKGKEKEGKD